MKNYLCSIILAIALISCGTSVNIYAQCPSGYTQDTLTLGPDAGGCSWVVIYCYKCGITGADPSNVIVTNIRPLNVMSGCIAPDKDELTELLIKEFYTNCTIPSCGDPQIDCDDALTMIIDYPMCWQWHILGIFSNGYHYYKWLQPCTTGYCEISYKVCIDPLTSLVVICPGSSVSYSEHDVTCSSTVITLPPDPNPNQLGEHTYGGCFVYESCP